MIATILGMIFGMLLIICLSNLGYIIGENIDNLSDNEEN